MSRMARDTPIQKSHLWQLKDGYDADACSKKLEVRWLKQVKIQLEMLWKFFLSMQISGGLEETGIPKNKVNPSCSAVWHGWSGKLAFWTRKVWQFFIFQLFYAYPYVSLLPVTLVILYIFVVLLVINTSTTIYISWWTSCETSFQMYRYLK